MERNITYEKMKDRLFVSVCNAEKNRELLNEIPHELKEDLALTYRIYYGADRNEGSTLIKNDDLKTWGVDADTLKADAWENMHRILPPFMKNLRQVFAEAMLGMFAIKETEISPKDAVVLTNGKNHYGAVYMFDQKLMSEIAEKLNCNLIVLPSSIHDVLLISDMGRLNELKQVVEDVNSNILSEEDFLSDEIYRYDRKEQTLSLVPQRELLFGTLPDESVNIVDMHNYGYTWEGMLPLTKGRAMELMDCGLQIFRLGRDGTEGILENRQEICSHDGIFGVEKEAWMNYQESQIHTEEMGMIPKMEQ